VKWNFGLSELAISERPSPGNSQSRLAAAPRYVFSGLLVSQWLPCR
jgi:hypothetical protein